MGDQTPLAEVFGSLRPSNYFHWTIGSSGALHVTLKYICSADGMKPLNLKECTTICTYINPTLPIYRFP